MGSMVVSRAVDRVFQPGRTKPKRIKLVFAASPWSLLKHAASRNKSKN
jgi:hypothetical protein